MRRVLKRTGGIQHPKVYIAHAKVPAETTTVPAGATNASLIGHVNIPVSTNDHAVMHADIDIAGLTLKQVQLYPDGTIVVLVDNTTGNDVTVEAGSIPVHIFLVKNSTRYGIPPNIVLGM